MKIETMQNELSDLIIRPYEWKDEDAVIELWYRCNLVTPQNEPKRDINMKLDVQPHLFLVGLLNAYVVASVMAGYEGHRGWINYLAVDPQYRNRGIGRQIMRKVEIGLRNEGCPKINLQIRSSNKEAIGFYQHLGYQVEDVISMGKRFEGSIK